ncbi:hypothetical protein [Escherichia coli IS25]|nr:hypothetical protein [Escherichia coli IS25]
MFCMFCVPVNSVLSDARPVGRIRRSRRIRQSMPDATLSRLIRPTTIADL